MDEEIYNIERKLKTKTYFYYFFDESVNGFSLGTYIYTLFFLRFFVIQKKYIKIIYIESDYPNYQKLKKKNIKFYRENFKYFAKIILQRNFYIKKIKKIQKRKYLRNFKDDNILIKKKVNNNETLHPYIPYILNKLLIRRKELLSKFFIRLKKKDIKNFTNLKKLKKRYITISLRYDLNFPRNRNVNSIFLNKILSFLTERFKKHMIIILSDIGGTKIMKKMISDKLSKKVVFSKDISKHISLDIFLLFNSVNNIGTTFTGGLFEILLFTQKPFFHHGHYSMRHNKVNLENYSFEKRKRFFWNTNKQIWVPTINHYSPDEIFVKIKKYL